MDDFDRLADAFERAGNIATARRLRKKADGRRRVHEIMKECGLQLRDLSDVPLYRATAPVRYADSAGNTWTGIGRRPKWVKRVIEAGLSLESYRVVR